MAKRKSRREGPKTIMVPRRVDRCDECGGTVRWRTTTAAKPYTFPDLGFPLQVSGLSVASCARCKATLAVVPNPERFRQSVIDQILRKKGPLTAPEIIFLRKHMHLT